jgi:gamma-glutamyltranspeptidase/glutathione hydrolase
MPTSTSESAMIATPHALASTAGLEVMREGGTAVDAAIAANAMLTVLLPDQTSIGGDCFFQVWEDGAPAPMGFNGSGRAPAIASADAVRAAGYASMPRRGPWTVVVPGTIDAWFRAHEQYGRLPMERLLEPAVAIARDGFEISPRLAAAIAANAPDLALDPWAATIFLDGGAAPAPGYRLANPALADSFELIASEGQTAFYTGAIAEAILAVAGSPNGWLAADDLANHAGEWVEAIPSRYREATVWELPPNSQGITAQLALAMMAREGFPGAWDDPAWLHVQIESKKRAFALRDRYLADPAAMSVTVNEILAPATIDTIWADFNPGAATPGQASLPGDTVYLAAFDSDRLAVSLIQSIYQGFGSGLVAGETGIVLQNRGSYFSLQPGHPNELAGGKRPLHTLMPAMIDIPGRVRGPIGTQGGDAQAQVHMQLVSHLVDTTASAGEAIDRPRWIAGDARVDPFAVIVEAGIPATTIESLQARGHVVTQVEEGWPNAGFAQMVLRDVTTGLLHGAADPRAEGSAEGL